MLTRGEHWFLRFAAALSFVVTALSLFTLQATFFPGYIVRSDAAASRAEWHQGSLILFEQRSLTLSTDVSAKIRRVLVSIPRGERINLHDGLLNLVAGENRIERNYLLPEISGVWCLRSTLEWQPRFSMVQHAAVLSDACFEVRDAD